MKTANPLIFAALGVAICNVSTGMVQGQTYTNDYGIWWYSSTNGAVTITGYGGSSSVVIIPDTITGLPVTSIGDWAFCGCTNLTFTIGNGITNIVARAFWNCTNLTNITVDLLNSTYSGVDGVLFDKNQTTLIQYPVGQTETSYTIPEGVTSIGDRAFSECGSLSGVTIPNSVTNIGDSAFASCSSLTGVYFQGKAPSFGAYVFCFQLLPWYPTIWDPATVYHMPGTTGWGSTFGGRPTAVWVLPNPVILSTTLNFGIQTNRFGFTISWATNISIVVEASTSLTNPTWTPVGTNTLTSGTSYFRVLPGSSGGFLLGENAFAENWGKQSE